MSPRPTPENLKWLIFPSVPFSKNGQKAVEDLHSALEGTFDYLKRLAAGAEDNHSPLTELPCNEGSLLFLRTFLQHPPMSSRVDNAVSCLQSVQSDIKKYRDKVDDAFLCIVELYNLTNNQQPSISTSSLAKTTIRDKFTRLLEPRESRRSGVGSENSSLNGEPTSEIAPTIRYAQERSLPGVPTSRLLLQLPPELLILVITLLNDDSLEDLPCRTNPLPTLRL